MIFEFSKRLNFVRKGKIVKSWTDVSEKKRQIAEFQKKQQREFEEFLENLSGNL